jgi:uncharacterized membrane protein YhaH (DUF805 family)
MNFQNSIKTCIKKKYANFSGRASRSEYWWFFLFYSLVGFASQLLDVFILGQSFWLNYGLINTIVNLILIIPILSVGARRLHDTNRSGWWQLIILIGIAITYYNKKFLTIGFHPSSLLVLVIYILLIFWLSSLGSNKKNRFGNPIKLKKKRKS